MRLKERDAPSESKVQVQVAFQQYRVVVKRDALSESEVKV